MVKNLEKAETMLQIQSLIVCVVCELLSVLSIPASLAPGEGVLRESTATPSDPSGSQGEPGRGERGGGESAAENQQDVSSEPEMVNDSSGEDEPGETMPLVEML